MSALSDLLRDVVSDVEAVFLFSPSSSHYERFADADLDADLVVVAPENAVEAETFVELPLEFDNVRDRIRFGAEGALEQGLVEEGDVVACSVRVFDGDPDGIVRVRIDESMRSGIYDLFANSRADPGVIRDVFEVAIELGKKGQKGKPVGALFVVGDAGKVMNKSR
ncbi:MAG: diadenylate cyclase domain-containing protein, partial [Halobellus sp.]